MDTKPAPLLVSLLGLVACHGVQTKDTSAGHLIGQMDEAARTQVVAIIATRGPVELATSLEPNGSFEVEVEADVDYRLWLDREGRRVPVAILEGETLMPEVAVGVGVTRDIGVIGREGDGHVARRPDPMRCMPDVSECEFRTYNIDVLVGDRFVLANLLDACHGRVGVDFSFDFEDEETWNLGAFNTNTPVEIVAADLEGGNHGDGEYRFRVVDADGVQIDHATIRIDHDDESDIRDTDALVPPPFGENCSDDVPSSPENPTDHGSL